ncbi:alpha/beta fold hydrolase [Actinokineospora pegani]|uniref:alpha/beta fold hydrolase n=1 Tax=Actinokineospora pegani TaxID=2654637 RepID=UPI0012EAADA1|nr:alpha/beta fold hydrolase [Actinokineospora pegani]
MSEGLSVVPRSSSHELDHVGLRFRTIHGYKRAFRMAGSGPAVLLVHGISDNSGTWLRVLSTLARDHTVIAPDLLGHGKSDKPRADYAAGAYACGMRDLLSVLDVDRVTVVGHSLGGGVAMQFAYQFPERCERLVLVSSGGVGREVHPALRVAAMPGAELAMPFIAAAPVRALVAGMMPLLRRTGLDFGPDLTYALERYAALRDPRARTAFLRTLRSVVDLRGQVVTMLDRCYLTRGIPTMLMWGTRDRIVPSAHARLAHEAMPGSVLEVFDRSGHFPHQSEPAKFISVLTSFIRETAPAEYDPQVWRAILRGGREPERAADPVTVARIDRATVSSGS